MTWTVEKLEQIPEVYRDFMMVLKPILDSREPGVVLRITGMPFGKFVTALSYLHDYDSEQVRQVAEQLRQRGLIEVDKLGFYTPTVKGEGLIRALAEAGEMVGHRVPPLPEF